MMLRAIRLNPDMANVMVVTEDKNLEVSVHRLWDQGWAGMGVLGLLGRIWLWRSRHSSWKFLPSLMWCRDLRCALGIRAKDRGRIIMYTCNMGEELALSHLTSETWRSVEEMDAFLL